MLFVLGGWPEAELWLKPVQVPNKNIESRNTLIFIAEALYIQKYEIKGRKNMYTNKKRLPKPEGVFW
jgi:hypothetical protein